LETYSRYYATFFVSELLASIYLHKVKQPDYFLMPAASTAGRARRGLATLFTPTTGVAGRPFMTDANHRCRRQNFLHADTAAVPTNNFLIGAEPG
jgi:hypothetical protein